MSHETTRMRLATGGAANNRLAGFSPLTGCGLVSAGSRLFDESGTTPGKDHER